MKEKKQTEEFDQWEAWAQRTYRTGGTQPPKTHGGLIAFLLVLVIFLCGVSTALGLMNIRLFRQLSAAAQPQTASVVFTPTEGPLPMEETTPLGFIGQTVPEFWRNYRDLPPGVYITEVLPGSDAFAQGIHPGDILIALEDTPTPDLEALQQLVAQLPPGALVRIRIHRAGQELDLSILLEP